MAPTVTLDLVQTLPTVGARAAAAFEMDGHDYIAIPQLARDSPDGPLSMTQGDSNIPLLIYEMDDKGHYTEFQQLSLPGGEDAEFFSINGRSFLATASLRSGNKSPYNMDVDSIIFEWTGESFTEFQRIPTFAAKQWRYFQIGDQHFLALAQGVEIPGVTSKVWPESSIFKWTGASFEVFQRVPSRWGYNWLHFKMEDGSDFLAYADHLAPSVLLKWDGERFVHYQTLDGLHGRAFCFLKEGDGGEYLVFSCLTNGTWVYRWDGVLFDKLQHLEGEGDRELTAVQIGKQIYVVQIRFITGTQEHPTTCLDSVIYKVENGKFSVALKFPTRGGTDAKVISHRGETRLVITESLTEKQSFHTNSRVYRLLVQEGNAVFQSPEFIKLFMTYTASKFNIGSELAATVTTTTSSYPLIVATSSHIILFPGNGDDPSSIDLRLGNRGFKELAAISHLGPALASLVLISRNGGAQETWQKHAEGLLANIQEVQTVNSENLWRVLINVEAFRGREASIAHMIDYACRVTGEYLETVLRNPDNLTPEFLRENLLDGSAQALNATIPFNAVMIATFFLVGLDISYRMRTWFNQYKIKWDNAMVLIVGQQGRETSGVTISTSSVAQIMLQTSNLELPLERLYIAPHAPVPQITASTNPDGLREYESKYRRLWNYLYGISQLGETMFSGYPAFKPESSAHPVISPATAFVSELPKISHPDDWFSMNTRMRVVVEDPRQLLSGCVTDYAAEQLRLSGGDLAKVIVPGLDGVDYRATSPLGLYGSAERTFTISSSPTPLRADLPIPIKSFKGNGGTLAFREHGSRNHPALLWVHGLPLDSRFWTAQYDRFTDNNYFNIFVDLRGYGSSSKIPSSVTDITQLYCEDILSVLDHVGVPQATLIGFASGGHIALRFAATHPSRVDRLVLLNGTAKFERSGDYPYGFTPEQIAPFLDAAETGGIEALTDYVLEPSLVFRDLSVTDAATVGSWFREMGYNAGLPTLLKFFTAMIHDDDRKYLPLIQAPCLVLSSSLGKEVPRESALYLREHLRDAMLVEVPNADHFFPVTRPDIVNGLIKAFLEQM